MDTIPCIPKIFDEGKPLDISKVQIFFKGEKSTQEGECWDTVFGHGPYSLSYYLDCRHPSSVEDLELIAKAMRIYEGAHDCKLQILREF